MVDAKHVAELYIALFGRLPEGEGLSYWEKEAQEKNLDLKTLAQEMYEAALQYPDYADLKDPKKLVETIYENVLGKTYQDDPDGINYWTEQIKKGHLTPGEVAGAIIYSALTQYPDHPATKTLLARAEAGLKVAEIFDKFEGDFTPFKELCHEIRTESDVEKAVLKALSLKSEKLPDGDHRIGEYLIHKHGHLIEVKAAPDENLKDKAVVVDSGEPKTVIDQTELAKMEKLAPVIGIGLEEVFTQWNWGETSRYAKETQPQYDIFVGDEGKVKVMRIDPHHYQVEGIDIGTKPVFRHYNGEAHYTLTPDFKGVKAEIDSDTSYEDWNGKYHIELEKGFHANIYAPEYDPNTKPAIYQGELQLKGAKGTVSVNGVPFTIEALGGTAKDGTTMFFRTNINLYGNIDYGGERFFLKTENLKVQSYSQDYSEYYDDFIITGKVELSDTDGNKWDFVYQANDPHSTADDLVGVYVNGEHIEDLHLL